MKDRVNYYILFPALIVAFLLETTLGARLFYGAHMPELVWIMLMAGTFLTVSADFLWAAFLMGFLSDAFAGSDTGLITMSYVFGSIAAYSLRLKLMPEVSLLKSIAIAALATIAFASIHALLHGLFFGGWGDISLGKLLADALFASLLIWPALCLIRKQRI